MSPAHHNAGPTGTTDAIPQRAQQESSNKRQFADATRTAPADISAGLLDWIVK